MRPTESRDLATPWLGVSSALWISFSTISQTRKPGQFPSAVLTLRTMLKGRNACVDNDPLTLILITSLQEEARGDLDEVKLR